MCHVRPDGYAVITTSSPHGRVCSVIRPGPGLDALAYCRESDPLHRLGNDGARRPVLDLDAEWTAGENGWHSRAESCCFAGRRLRGRVLITTSAGSLAYRDRTTALAEA